MRVPWEQRGESALKVLWKIAINALKQNNDMNFMADRIFLDLHVSLICLGEKKVGPFLIPRAILRINEIICSLHFDHKERTTG